MSQVLRIAHSSRFAPAIRWFALLASIAIWIAPAAGQLTPVNPATTSTTPRTIQLERPIFINLPCPDEALKLLLLSEEGIMWNPEGRIGNQQLSDIVSEVRVVYPDVAKLGRHREELVAEILGLLNAARQGTYVPPSQRQGSLRPGVSFPNVFDPQAPGDLAQAGRQDSTIPGDRPLNPANNAASSPPALNSGLPDRFQPATPSFGNSVVNQQPASGFQTPMSGAQPQTSPLATSQLSSVNPQFPPTAGSGGWADRNGVSQLPNAGGLNLQQASQSPGNAAFNSGLSGPRPPALAVPDRGTTGFSGFSTPNADPTRLGSSLPNLQNGGFAQNAAGNNGFGSPAGQLAPINGQAPTNPASSTATPQYIAELTNELVRMREQFDYQNSRLNQMQLDNQTLQQTNQALQQNLVTAQRGAGYAQLPPSQGLYTSTGAGTDLSAGNNDALASNGVPPRRGGANGAAPTGLGLAGAIAGPTPEDANHQTLLERQNMLLWLFLAASIGLNIYLSMIARGLYVRYGDLADELRETFTATA